ncbi:MAG TPA: hypothetical protein VEG29_03190, partial [Candidatus Binatia bacterium]|nr:hypothetical protein [Candidatus Binatia bacterium]
TDEDTDSSIRGIFLTDAAELRAFRGEPIDRYIEAIAGLPDLEGGTIKLATSHWVASRQAYVDGRLDVAREEFLAFGDLFDPNHADAHLEAARFDILAGEASLAKQDLEVALLGKRKGRLIDADRISRRAGIAALEGRPTEALAGYRQALTTYRDLDLAWDEALCAIEMATVLDPADPEVRAAADAARPILIRLGAMPFLARLDEALARKPTSSAVRTTAERSEVATG